MFRNLVFISILCASVGCSKSQISRTSITNDILSVEQVNFRNDVVFDETGKVEAEAVVNVSVNSAGVKTISSEGFKMTIDASGNTVYDNNSVLYSGAAIPLVSASGGKTSMFASFAGRAKFVKGPKDIAMEIANYQLIKKARENGASAIFLPSYEWEVKEDSESKSMFFGLWKKIVKQDVSYKVKVFAKTIRFVPARGKEPQAPKSE